MWEYKTVRIDNFRHSETILNDLGKEGWELVNFIQYTNLMTFILAVLKREIK